MRTAGHATCAAWMQLHRPVSEGSLLQHLLREGPLDVHDQLQHFIVGLAWEQDLASEQLINDRAHAPDIQGMICSTRQGLVTPRMTKRLAVHLYMLCGASVAQTRTALQGIHQHC